MSLAASSYSGISSSLQRLDLSDNQLAGEIPSWFQNLTSLETLDFSYNQFTGNIGLSPLIHLLSLKDLRLSHNHFQIPNTFQSFANHTKLKYFYGDWNQVVDEVTEANVQPFTLRLEELDLSNCAVSAFPPFLRHQRDLIFISLSDCTWSSNMAYLYLNDNGFSGFLTDEFLNSIIFVELLDLSSNKLSDHIPTSIGDLPNLGSLNLRGNQFEGHIPIQLCNLLSFVYVGSLQQ